jgi:nicotinamidase-related amidase
VTLLERNQLGSHTNVLDKEEESHMSTISIDPKTSALVLIDLQHGIVGRPGAPRSGAEVVANAVRLAAKFRERGTIVALVRVSFAADRKDAVTTQVDAPMQMSGPLPPNWSELVPDVGPRDGDLVITKRQWGAFYGTDLDLHLRRRGVRTIVLGGIATNFGVESTARDAFERAYQLIFAEDAMTSLTAEGHEFVIKNIFPRLGLVRSTSAVLEALG